MSDGLNGVTQGTTGATPFIPGAGAFVAANNLGTSANTDSIYNSKKQHVDLSGVSCFCNNAIC